MTLNLFLKTANQIKCEYLSILSYNYYCFYHTNEEVWFFFLTWLQIFNKLYIFTQKFHAWVNVQIITKQGQQEEERWFDNQNFMEFSS